MRATRLSALGLMVLGLLAAASPAAADRVYFGSNTTISYANLDGSGGGNLEHRRGDGRLAEGDRDRPGGGADLLGQRGSRVEGLVGQPRRQRRRRPAGHRARGHSTPGALPSTPPPAGSTGRTTRRAASEAITYASFDGSVVGFLPTTGATASEPTGVAIDPASGRLYWSNYAGQDLLREPRRQRRRRRQHHRERSARLPKGWRSTRPAGGSTGPTMKTRSPTSRGSPTPGSTAAAAATWRANRRSNSREGVAIDPTTDRAYWANSAAFSGTGSISYGSLEGGQGGSLNLAGAVTTPGIAYPALLKAPLGTGAPKLTAQIALRPRFLTCDEGDLGGRHAGGPVLPRAPQLQLPVGQGRAAGPRGRPGPTSAWKAGAAATTPAR